MLKRNTILMCLSVLLTSCISDPEYLPYPREGTVVKKDVGQDLEQKNDLTNDASFECINDTGCSSDTVCKENTCVECIDNTKCDLATDAKCTDQNTCGQCVDDSDCTHIVGLPRCDLGECKIECETDSHCKDDEVCDLREGDTKNTCQMGLKNQAQCQPCKSTSECDGRGECVQMNFGSENHGYYCLQKSSTATPCTKPFQTAISRKSLGGTNEKEYCGVNEALTTCDAVLVSFKDIDCKVSTANLGDSSKCDSAGSTCEQFSAGVWKCSYECSRSSQCVTSCVGLPNTGYCN